MVTGTTPISGLPTGTIDSLLAIVPMSVGLPSTADTIQSSLIQVAKFLGIQGFISENGAMLTYITGTSYRLEAGSAIVNDQMLTWSSPITRTGLTMVSGTTSYVYLYASGTSTAALEESTTVPVWDSTLSYYKKTNDPTRRCIGFLHAETTNRLRKFLNTVSGRVSEYMYDDGNATTKRPLNGGTEVTNWASFSLAPFVPSHATHWYALPKLSFTSGGDDTTFGISPTDLGSANGNTAPFQVRDRGPSAGAASFTGSVWLPIRTSQTYFYKLQVNAGAVASAILECHGARIIR